MVLRKVRTFVLLIAIAWVFLSSIIIIYHYGEKEDKMRITRCRMLLFLVACLLAYGVRSFDLWYHIHISLRHIHVASMFQFVVFCFWSFRYMCNDAVNILLPGHTQKSV